MTNKERIAFMRGYAYARAELLIKNNPFFRNDKPSELADKITKEAVKSGYQKSIANNQK